MPKWNISLRDNLKINNHKKVCVCVGGAVERTALPFPVDFKGPSNKQVIFVPLVALIIQNYLCLNQHWNN